MAIARGPGTEIIRNIHLEDVEQTIRPLIIGVQHHIYTVINITVMAVTLNDSGDAFTCFFNNTYDAFAGTSAQFFYIFRQEMNLNQTFVWSDKFSFMGTEPTDFTATIDSVAKMDAIADQATTTSQQLQCDAEHPSDRFDVTCTYIDQNNA